MLPVYSSSKQLNFEQVFNIPPHQIDFDWYGEQLKNPPRFVLAKDTINLFFAAFIDSAPFHDPTAAQGEFVEGLWNKDVAEFFIANSGTPTYQEFNLSPSGAWWSCLFSKYRKRDIANFRMPNNIKTCAALSASSWRAALSIPLTELSIPIDFETDTRINICFALGKTKRRYVSWANIQNYDPDFHRAEDFEDVDILELP